MDEKKITLFRSLLSLNNFCFRKSFIFNFSSHLVRAGLPLANWLIFQQCDISKIFGRDFREQKKNEKKT